MVLPLLPGFEGQIGTASGIAMQTILHWNYASISRLYIRFIEFTFGPCQSENIFRTRGSNSLLVKLRDANIDPLNYISFYGLRTHSRLNKELVCIAQKPLSKNICILSIKEFLKMHLYL